MEENIIIEGTDYDIRNVEKVSPMTGWKTKTAAIVGSIGTALVGVSDAVPSDTLAPWVKFVGILLDGVAGALAVWGIGHKLEKNRPVLVKEKKIPYYIQRIDDQEMKLLENFRSKKSAQSTGSAAGVVTKNPPAPPS